MAQQKSARNKAQTAPRATHTTPKPVEVHEMAEATESAPELLAAAVDTDEPSTFAEKAATVALVGLGVALIEVELIPGMLIGIAAMAAPNLLPRLGNAFRPLLKSTVKAGYALAERAREVAAEAGEQFQDVVAEAKAEHESAAAHQETA